MAVELTYKIVRYFFRSERHCTVRTGLTLEKAQAHCKSHEASSKTAVTRDAVKRTRKSGAWFDGYEVEGCGR